MRLRLLLLALPLLVLALLASPLLAPSPALALDTALYVDAVAGSDLTGDGSQLRPLQTIAFAVSFSLKQQAQTTSLTLRLAAGVYQNSSVSLFCGSGNGTEALSLLSLSGSGPSSLVGISLSGVGCAFVVSQVAIASQNPNAGPSTFAASSGSIALDAVHVADLSSFQLQLVDSSLTVTQSVFELPGNASGADTLESVISAVSLAPSSARTPWSVSLSNCLFRASGPARRPLVFVRGARSVSLTDATFANITLSVDGLLLRPASAVALLSLESVQENVTVARCLFTNNSVVFRDGDTAGMSSQSTNLLRVSTFGGFSMASVDVNGTTTFGAPSVAVENAASADFVDVRFLSNINVVPGAQATLTLRQRATAISLVAPDAPRVAASLTRPVFGCNTLQSCLLTNCSQVTAPVYAPGSWALQALNASFLPCAAGALVENALPFACPAGYARSVVTCVLCSAGSAPDETQSSCVQCPPGFYSGADGSASCAPCSADTYSSDSGSASCFACNNAMLTSVEGSSACSALTNLCIGLIVAALTLIVFPSLVLGSEVFRGLKSKWRKSSAGK